MEEKIDEMVNELLEKKKMMKSNLKSAEKSLLKSVIINPDNWNSNSLEISLTSPQADQIASSLEMNILINKQFNVQKQENIAKTDQNRSKNAPKESIDKSTDGVTNMIRVSNLSNITIKFA